MKKTIVLKGQTVEYELSIKQVKRLNLRIKPDLRVLVSAYPTASEEHIECFIRDHQELVLSSLKQFSDEQKLISPLNYVNGEKVLILGRWFPLHVEKGKNNVILNADSVILTVEDDTNFNLKKDVFTRWQHSQLENVVKRECKSVFAKLDDIIVSFPTIKFKSVKTYWGICYMQNECYQITFNYGLFCVPIECIRYIVAHEFAHTIHLDHSNKFYNVLRWLCPDYAQQKERLKKYLFVLQQN